MLGPVSISVPTLLAEILIFLGMVWAMERLVFSPIRHVWAERDRLIQEGLASAGEGRDEAAQAREEVRRILVNARTQAQQEIDTVTTEGKRERDHLVAEATTEFKRLVAEAQQQIAAERSRSARDLSNRIVDLALQAAARVSGRSYDQPQIRELAAAVVMREGLA
jgi:F-type H+-transporting ATPase subunit b